MNDLTPDAYGTITEPATLTIQRLLPGPVERIWAYLTEPELRRKWFADGIMTMQVGAPFTLTWRNDELTTPPGNRPPDFGPEHSMESRIKELDPPRRLAMEWGSSGGVTFDLEPRGERVLLTVTHHRLPDRPVTTLVGAGWHAHLDILAARLAGEEPEPYWDYFARLRQDYEARVPA